MTSNQRRLKRERHTIQLMIGIYCRGRHQRSGTLCVQCQQLSDYAMKRVDKCPFQEAKPTCAKCPIHCYNATMREQVREVMRYAGPRMMLHHPLLSLLHSLDGMWYSQEAPPPKIRQKDA